MIAAVAPEIPAAGLFVIGLAAALTALFLVMLRFTAITLVGSLLHWIGSALRVIPVFGGWASDKIDKGVNAVDEALGNAVAASAELAIEMLHDAWKLTVWVGDTIADLASATEHAVTTLVTTTIPTAVKNASYPVAQRLAGIDQRIRSVEREALAELRNGIDRLTRRGEALTRELEQRVKAAEATAEGALTGEIAKVRREALHGIDEIGDTLGKRLGVVERALGIGALAGVIEMVLARNWPWIRCQNVGKIGKHLCRWPIKALEDLLEGAIAVLVLYDICKLIPLMEAVAFKMEPFIIEFNKSINSLANCRGVTAAGPIDLSYRAIPPVSRALPL